MSLLHHAGTRPEADTVAHLRAVPFFARLSDASLKRLASRCPRKRLAAQRILYRAGDSGDTLYVILSGQVELTHALDGAPVRVTLLAAGEYFGELAVLDDSPRSATARALAECVLLQVRKKEFLELLGEYPQLFADAARVLSARLREANARQLAAAAREKRELEKSNRRWRANYAATLEALSSALDLRDQATQGHSQRVTAYTLLIADHVGVPQEQREALRLGALLHDIGKIGVADAILHKPATLTPNEWAVMKKHPEWGAAIIERIEFLHDARDIVLAHHEKFDGSGYPRGLSGSAIPLGARIFAVADVFDAVTTFRPYRMPMSPQDAVTLIRRESGRHFDPEIVAAFEKALPKMLEVMRKSFADEP